MLLIVKTIAEVREAVAKAKCQVKVVGFVATMGALHEGHGELIRQCKRDSGFVVVSIFVNPTQFGPKEDFTQYPRTLEADAKLCEAAGADMIFHPEVATMYPDSRDSMCFVGVPGISTMLEGTSRPGHFEGVATVVLKLFSIVGPDLAHFGTKDYQQLLVIRKLVKDLDLPLEIRGVETVREADGLAMSSRNRYLNAEERQAATVLSRALRLAAQVVKEGERSGDRVRQILRRAIELEPLARVDYAEVADAETLESLDTLSQGCRAVALLAVRVGPARLIDNLTLPG